MYLCSLYFIILDQVVLVFVVSLHGISMLIFNIMQCRLLWSFSRSLQNQSAVTFSLSLMTYLVKTQHLLELLGTLVCYVVNHIPSFSYGGYTHFNHYFLKLKIITSIEWRGRPFPFSKGCSFYRLEVLEGTRKIM